MQVIRLAVLLTKLCTHLRVRLENEAADLSVNLSSCLSLIIFEEQKAFLDVRDFQIDLTLH